MVLVRDSYCVDRYEMSLVDESSELPLSPYYPPLPAFDQYLKDRQAEGARLFVPTEENAQPGVADFPQLPEWQQRGRYKPKAIARKGVTPNAYLMLAWARDACGRAGKRLCTLEEWRTACRGEQERQFPYGDTYKAGVCNVFREDHPGRVLFNKVTVGMLDPRMNRIAVKGKPLLRKTGATPACASTWGADAIYDMVGNLDEWIDDPEGTFVGGFYSRTATNGCEKTVTAHSAIYYDYSTGGRCCADGRTAKAPAIDATP
jgi:formylglycine-generating enzyme required for sulfatase activity